MATVVTLMQKAQTQECPLCGGAMQLKQMTRTDRFAEFSSAPPRTIREWVCSRCDYFEDADKKDD